jgi:hypothetical protein
MVNTGGYGFLMAEIPGKMNYFYGFIFFGDSGYDFPRLVLASVVYENNPAAYVKAGQYVF